MAGSYGGEGSGSDISRGVALSPGLISPANQRAIIAPGLFAGTEGTRRILSLFDKHEIKAFWLIPGHSPEPFPEEATIVRDAGHEIGLHGYSPENPLDMTPDQQRAVLDKAAP